MTRLYVDNSAGIHEPNTPAGGYLQQEIERIAEREMQARNGRAPTDEELEFAMYAVIEDKALFDEARAAAAKRHQKRA